MSLSVTSLEVAESNAELLAEATAEAAHEADNFAAVVQSAAMNPAPSMDRFDAAVKALSAANDSYRLAEAAVFYVDPGSSEELSAQPDPLGAGSEEQGEDSFAAISAMLEDLVAASEGKLDTANLDKILPILRDLATRSRQLSSEMEALAAAWRTSDTSFRERYFMASPENAVARIFQGLLALSGDVLPNRWLAAADAGEGAVPAAAEISGRVDALRNIYRGGRGDASSAGAPGLGDLVSAVSPLRAAATEAAVAQAAALAKALEFSPENVETKRQLLLSLGEVTKQLTLSAETLGIRVVESRTDKAE